MEKKHSVNKRYILYGVLAFLIMYVFYTRVEPLMINDPDDWMYIGNIRTPVPIWKAWNPAKVFPETFEGLFGFFAAFVVYPLCGEYVMSFTYVFAFIVSFAFAIYLIAVCRFCEKVLSITELESICISLVFFSFHFIIFRRNEYEITKFLLTASDLNCFMNYTVPMLLNSVLALWLSKCFLLDDSKDDILAMVNEGEYYKAGMILIALYFAVFSNMTSNIVLIAPCMVIFLCRMMNRVKDEGIVGVFKITFWKRNILLVTIFVLELICLIFEANGGRASSISVNWSTAFSDTYDDLKYVFSLRNPLVWVTMLIAIGCGTVLAIFEKKDETYKKCFAFVIASGWIVGMYMFLLCSRTGESNITRPENLLTILFFTLLLFTVSLGKIVQKYRKSVIIVFVSGILFGIYAIGGNYEQSMSYYDGDGRFALMVNNNIIEQFINADLKRVDQFELHLPTSGLGYYPFSGERIATTLYRHKIVNMLHHPVTVLENDYLYFTDSSNEKPDCDGL